MNRYHGSVRYTSKRVVTFPMQYRTYFDEPFTNKKYHLLGDESSNSFHPYLFVLIFDQAFHRKVSSSHLYITGSKNQCSVPDLWRFDTDPDLQIRITGLRIRILLLFPVASRCHQEIRTVLQGQHVFKKSKTVEIKVFLHFIKVLLLYFACC